MEEVQGGHCGSKKWQLSPSEVEDLCREDVRPPSLGGVRGMGAYRGICGAPLPSDTGPKKLPISAGGTGQLRLGLFAINADSKTWSWHKWPPKGNVTSLQCLQHDAAKPSLSSSPRLVARLGDWAEGILANTGPAWSPQSLRGMCDQSPAFRHSLQAREEKM